MSVFTRVWEAFTRIAASTASRKKFPQASILPSSECSLNNRSTLAKRLSAAIQSPASSAAQAASASVCNGLPALADSTCRRSREAVQVAHAQSVRNLCGEKASLPSFATCAVSTAVNGPAGNPSFRAFSARLSNRWNTTAGATASGSRRMGSASCLQNVHQSRSRVCESRPLLKSSACGTLLASSASCRR